MRARAGLLQDLGFARVSQDKLLRDANTETLPRNAPGSVLA